MKKTILTLLIASVISINTYATNVQGYVINNNGEKLNTTVVVPTNFRGNVVNFLQLQNKVKCINTKQERIAFKPDEIKEFGFTFRGKNIVMHAVNDNLNLKSVFTKSNKVFLKLEQKGELCLYTFIASAVSQFTDDNKVEVNSKHYIYKLNDLLHYIPSNNNERYLLATLLDNCKIVKQRLLNNYYITINENQIVKDYNKHCVKDNVIANY